jgi:hypothetical protein
VVSCIDIPEVPEKLVLEMGSNNYRNNLFYMLKKVMGWSSAAESSCSFIPFSTPHLNNNFSSRLCHDVSGYG